MCIKCAKKCKNIFFAIFLSLVARIDSVLQMMAVLNISQHLAVVLGHAQLNTWAYTICINCAHMHIGLFSTFAYMHMHIAYDGSLKSFSIKSCFSLFTDLQNAMTVSFTTLQDIARSASSVRCSAWVGLIFLWFFIDPYLLHMFSCFNFGLLFQVLT